MSGLRRTPLVRKTPMPSGVTPLRRTAMKAEPKPKKRPRGTGPSKATKDLLWVRADARCEICGTHITPSTPFSRHHRRARGSGGSTVEWINDVSNLLLLCGSATTPGGCHQLVETQKAIAYAQGWVISLHGSDHPTEVPVILHAFPGPMYLTTAGTYSEEHPCPAS